MKSEAAKNKKTASAKRPAAARNGRIAESVSSGSEKRGTAAVPSAKEKPLKKNSSQTVKIETKKAAAPAKKNVKPEVSSKKTPLVKASVKTPTKKAETVKKPEVKKTVPPVKKAVKPEDPSKKNPFVKASARTPSKKAEVVKTSAKTPTKKAEVVKEPEVKKEVSVKASAKTPSKKAEVVKTSAKTPTKKAEVVKEPEVKKEVSVKASAKTPTKKAEVVKASAKTPTKKAEVVKKPEVKKEVSVKASAKTPTKKAEVVKEPEVKEAASPVKKTAKAEKPEKPAQKAASVKKPTKKQEEIKEPEVKNPVSAKKTEKAEEPAKKTASVKKPAKTPSEKTESAELAETEKEPKSVKAVKSKKKAASVETQSVPEEAVSEEDAAQDKKNGKAVLKQAAVAKNDTMKVYMHDIGQISLVTKDQEKELADKIHGEDMRAHDEARTTLIRANLRLVVKIAHDFKGLGLPLLDLISEGNIGLMRAVEKFDPAKGAKFSSYAAWWIKQSMRRALANQSRTIRIPVQSAGKINKIKSVRMKLTEKFGREPTDAEIAEHLDYSERTVAGLRLADLRTFSLQDPIQQGEDGEFQDIIPDRGTMTPDRILSDVESVGRLISLLGELDIRERMILQMRFGLDGKRPKTLEEVSQEIGRTRERVRQIQNQALTKLRALLADESGFAND